MKSLLLIPYLLPALKPGLTWKSPSPVPLSESCFTCFRDEVRSLPWSPLPLPDYFSFQIPDSVKPVPPAVSLPPFPAAVTYHLPCCCPWCLYHSTGSPASLHPHSSHHLHDHNMDTNTAHTCGPNPWASQVPTLSPPKASFTLSSIPLPATP